MGRRIEQIKQERKKESKRHTRRQIIRILKPHTRVQRREGAVEMSMYFLVGFLVVLLVLVLPLLPLDRLAPPLALPLPLPVPEPVLFLSHPWQKGNSPPPQNYSSSTPHHATQPAPAYAASGWATRRRICYASSPHTLALAGHDNFRLNYPGGGVHPVADAVAEGRTEQPSAPEASSSSPAPKQPDSEKKPEDEPPSPKVEEETQEIEVLTPPSPTLLPEAETEGLTSGAVQPPGSTGVPPTPERPTANGDGNESDRTSFTEDDDLNDVDMTRTTRKINLSSTEELGSPLARPLLPPIAPIHAGRKCLVLDLDETLVHSSFKSISQADYVVPVEIEYHWHNVYVIKRPGVDNFLKKMGEIYEIVVFTASLSKYADPVLDKLDIHQVVAHRLFRESCYNHKGNYVKVCLPSPSSVLFIDAACQDLSQLGRPIIPVSSWFNDPHDTELTDLVPFLTDLAAVDDVRGILDGAR
ncbi:hypothetical protein NMY22_g17992 [Coprinellus aureogranulatus]|nr:hypothetical protein NMY22_g17992 [Coprinellus aureogranulatus]